jgi:MAF protein
MKAFNNLSKYNILLASNSPRRRELLSGLDISYEVVALPDVDESYPADLQHSEIPTFIARQKAAAYESHLEENTLLITADTIVWLDGEVFGKPADEEDAVRMLKALSGKTHDVITGVCLNSKEKQISFHVTSGVTFAQLDEEEIRYYVEKYRPFDKAGAYGIQEWIGYVGVKELKGSYFNVVGLPIQRLYEALKGF